MAFEKFTGTLDAAPSGGFVPFSGELDQPAKPVARAMVSASDPMGGGFDEIMAVSKPAPTSVLEGVQMDKPAFNADESSRLSNRKYAEASQPASAKQRLERIEGKTIPVNEQGTFGRAGGLIGSQLDSYAAGLGYKLGDAAEAVGAKGIAKDLKARGSALQGRADTSAQSISLSADGAFEKYAPQILAVFPTMAVAAVSGGLPVMFGIAEVQQYAEGRKAGLTPGMALARSVPMASAEVIGEKLGGTGKLIEALEKAAVKGGSLESLKELSGRMLASGMREVPSEEVTYAMQFGIDKMPGIGLKPNAGLDDFIDGAKDTAIVAAGAGGMIAGGGMAVNRLAAREQSFADKYPVPPATLPGVPPAPVDPVAEIGKAQTVDQAIAAAQTSVQSSAAVDNIGQILQAQGLMTMPAPLPNMGMPTREQVAADQLANPELYGPSLQTVLTPDIAAVTQSITELEAVNAQPIQPAAQPAAVPIANADIAPARLPEQPAATAIEPALDQAPAIAPAGIQVPAATSGLLVNNGAPEQSNTPLDAEVAVQKKEPASWVIRNKETGEVVMETFDKAKVNALNTVKYEAVPIQDYLVGVNQQIKSKEVKPAADPSQPKPNYSEMSYAELEKAYEQGLKTNDELDVAAVKKYMGDAVAKDFAALSRRGKDAWMNKNATVEMENESSAFKGINEDDIRAHLSAVNDFDTESANALGVSIALKTKDADKPGYVGSPDYTAAKNAFRYAKEQGWSEEDVMAGMRSRATAWAGSDAPELFTRLFKQTVTPAAQVKPADQRLIPVSKRVPDVQNQSASEPITKAQAAPAQAPEAGAGTGIQPTAAGSQAGSAGLEADGLKVSFDGKTYPVNSIRDAQDKWNEFRRVSDGGVSEVGNGVKVTNGKGETVAKISYNGRAWDAQDNEIGVQLENDDQAVKAKPADQRLIPVSKRTPETPLKSDNPDAGNPASAIVQEIQAQAAIKNVAPDFTKDLADARAGLADLQAKRKLTRSSKRADIDGQIERVKAAIVEMESSQAGSAAPAIEERPDPAVQRAEFAKKEKTRQDKAARLRNYTFVKSPFLAFLGKHGVALSRKADFSPDKNPLLSGYGPIFRRAGKNTDLLVQNAIEEHFLPEGADSTALDNLISQQISGMGVGQTKRIEAVYSPDVADRVMNERMQAAQDDFQEELAAQQEAAQNEGIDPVDGLMAIDFTDLSDIEDTGYDSAPPAVQLEVNALIVRAKEMGIDTDEITEQAFDNTREGTPNDYYQAAKQALDSAIGQATVKAGNGNSSQDTGQQSNAGSETENVAHSARIPKEIIDLGFKLLPATRTGGAQNEATWTSAEAAPYTRVSVSHTPNPDTYRVTVGGRFVAPLGENALPTSELGQYKSIDTLLAAIKPVMDKATLASEGLSAPSRQDILDQQQRKENADKAEVKANADAQKKEKAEREAADIKQAGATSANRFVLGGSAEAELSGQGGMFDDPVGETKATLDANNITGKERLDVLKDVKSGALTVDEVKDAYPNKLADFGQALPGARKDAAPSFKTELSDSDIATQPLSKIWPADEYLSIEDKFASAIAFAARAEIPAKPRNSYRVKNWVEKVKTVRQLAQRITSGATTRERMAEELAKSRGLSAFADKVALLEAIDRDSWGRIDSVEVYKDAYKYNADGTQTKTPLVRVSIDGRSRSFDGATSVADVVERVSAMLGTELQQTKKIQFEVRGTEIKGYGVNKKGDKEYRRLKTLPTAKEAFEYIKTSYDELVAAWEGVKDRDNVKEDDVRGTENRPRTAKDYRNGKDVSSDEFADTFGFRGGQFGNWVNQGEGRKDRQGMLNQAYDALMDLADIVGVPPKAISLNGTLGIAFGARGSGKASAHYEPDTLVINLTKTRGAGVLAHEWFHALDNYFSHQRGGAVPMAAGMTQLDYRKANYITYRPEPLYVHKTKQSTPITKATLDRHAKTTNAAGYYNPDNWQIDPKHPQGVRPEVERRMSELVDALNASPMAQRAAMNDKSPEGYWGRIIERAARSFENYVISKMLERGYHNDYLANVREVGDFPRSKERYPYLFPEEVKPIAEAFDNLFSTIETKENDAGDVAMFSRSADPEAQKALEALSQNDELFALPKSDKKTVEGIVEDANAGISVSKEKDAVGRTVYTFTMDNGKTATLSVRPFNPYATEEAPTLYGYTLKDGELTGLAIERPGNNPEDAGELDDVWVDVSNLKTGTGGAMLYNIAQTYAHNTGRIFIGDPAGLTDEALRRRTEQMLSSALKFGTTRHLAPHPRQVEGDAALGIAPLQWTYGDDLGNIQSLIETSVRNYRDVNPFTFEPSTGRFLDSEGNELDGSAISLIVRGTGLGETGAGRTTLQRAAIFESLVREGSGTSSGDGRRAGILERLVELSREFGASTYKVFYSRSTDPVKADQANALVQQQVDGLKANWANAPEVVVAFDLQDPKIPQRVRDEDLKQRSGGATGTPEGFYYKGVVYLMSSQLKSIKDTERVLFHEALGHAGLRGVFGKALNPILREIVLMRPKEVNAKIAEYGLRGDNELDRMTAAEEVLAELAQTRPELGIVKRAIAAIRTWLRANVPGFKNLALTDADIIANYILPARGWVERGQQANVGGMVPAFSRDSTDQTNTPAFKKWFGDSKVVDASGKPLTVYHGTAQNFTEFKKGKNVNFDNAQRLLGFFFAGDKAYAAQYGSTVMPVYLSVQNPFKAPASKIDALENSSDRNASKWVKSLKDKGFDGIQFGEGVTVEYVAFNPAQIKSATDNNGDFDGNNPDIRFSRKPIPNSAQAEYDDTLATDGWAMPEPTKTDKLIFNLQDGRIDLKRVQEAIKATGAEIAEKFDARQAETLYPGRVARRSETFLNIEVKPILQDMALNKIDMAELGDYLIARHAPERNAQIAKVNPDLPDGGAGSNSQGVLMTDDAAAEYLAAIPADKLAKLINLARKVDAITAGTRALLVGEGLEKQDTVDAWTKAYKNYVPLFKDEAEHSHPQGRGFTVKGSASKRSTGSTKEVTNLLAHVLMQRETAITRAEKNRVGLALYGLALSNPNTDFWTTIKPNMTNEQVMAELQAMGVDPLLAGVGMASAPTVRTVDPLTDKVVDRPNPMYKNLPGAITLRVNGEDRVLMLNQDNERAMRMAENLKNMDGLTAIDWSTGLLHTYVSQSIPKYIAVGPATRWIASVNTQYNPAFGLINVTRDTLGGIVNLTNTPLRKQKMKVLANVPAALKGIARDLRGDTRTEWSDLFNQFQDDGAQTGYKEMFRTADDRAKAVEKEIASAGKSGLTPGKMAHAVLDLLDDFNTSLENAVRLSAYKAALDEGMSRPASAKLARELTVDFNRKGRLGREVAPLYAFFNAAVQGTARTLETMAGPAGAKIIAGGLALGGLQALMLAFAGFEDDEPPEFIKSRALIIPIGGEKRYIAIPYPLGLHVIPNTGRVLTELSINGAKDWGKRTGMAIGEIAGAFNPMGGGNIFTTDGALRTLAPTIIDPLIELASNKNFAGTEIEKKPFYEEGDNRPGFQRARESTQRTTTGQAYLGISKAINTMTGGNDFEAGIMSPTPERMRYLAQVVGGGVLREFEKSINTSMGLINDEEVTARGIPVVGRFYGEIDANQSERSGYFDTAKTIKKYETSRKAADKAGATEIADNIAKKHPELEMADYLNNVQGKISKLNKLAAETINDRAELKRIDNDRFELMKDLNDEIKLMERDKREPTIAERLRK